MASEGNRFLGKKVSKKKSPEKETGQESDQQASEIAMSVSGICGQQDDRYAFVQFTQGVKFCEFKFPAVELKVNDGFSEEELVQMRFYVKNHISELKKMAASVDPFHAFKAD